MRLCHLCHSPGFISRKSENETAFLHPSKTQTSWEADKECYSHKHNGIWCSADCYLALCQKGAIFLDRFLLNQNKTNSKTVVLRIDLMIKPVCRSQNQVFLHALVYIHPSGQNSELCTASLFSCWHTDLIHQWTHTYTHAYFLCYPVLLSSVLSNIFWNVLSLCLCCSLFIPIRTEDPQWAHWTQDELLFRILWS